MTPDELAQLVKKETRWTGTDSVLAVAVCLGESGGNPKAYNGRGPDQSYGLWQVNMIGSLGAERRKKYHLSSNEDLFNPVINAHVAQDIYDEAGKSFRPWGAYTNGSYKRHLEVARKATENVAWRLVQSLVQLRNEINTLAPNRDKTSDGTIGDTAHSARTSDHNPESDGTVDALDIDHDPAHGCDVDKIFEEIIKRRDKRVKYLIRRGRIISGNDGPSPWQWRDRGKDPNTDHALHGHISVLDKYQDDTSSWLGKGFLMALTEAEQKELLKKVIETWKAVYETRDGAIKEHMDIIEQKLDQLLAR